MNKYVQLNTDVLDLQNSKKNITKEQFNQEKKGLNNIINLELIQIQSNIDERETLEINKIKDNIEKVKTLLSQINNEFNLVKSDYESKVDSYKFPLSISELHNRISELKNKFNNSENEKNKLNEKINKKQLLLESKNIQKMRIESLLKNKKFKMCNNSEILAVIEKKNSILKNKNKLLEDLDKKIQKHRHEILKKNNMFNQKIKNLDNTKQNNIARMDNSLKKIQNKEYNFKNGEIIKEREILIIKNNISKLEENYFNNLKIAKDELNLVLQRLEAEIKEFDDEKDTINNEYGHSDTLFDKKISELTNKLPNLRIQNFELDEEIKDIKDNIKKLNNKKNKYNYDYLKEDILNLESLKEEKERKSVREYESFKNIYDLKLDELNGKKHKFENKILSLRNKINNIENNKDKSQDELGESKKFLVNLLKNLKNIN